MASVSLTVSALVSLTVSAGMGAFTFVAGTRLGKNNADRAPVRAVYQALFEHFAALRAAIQEGKPKVWSDFKSIGDRYVPLVGEMKHDGRSNLVPPKVWREVEAAEELALRCGSLFRKAVREAFGPAVKAKFEERVIDPRLTISNRSYRAPSLYRLAGDPASHEGVEFEGSMGLSLAIPTENGRSIHLYANGDGMKGDATLQSLLHEIVRLADEPQMRDAREQLEKATRRLARIESLLSGRIRDPHPLYETLSVTLRDLFVPSAA